jgi:hypothetical protein
MTGLKGPNRGTALLLSPSNHYLYTAIKDSGVYRTAVITTVLENGKSLPTVVSLFQNYPNPFNPATTIQYSLPAKVFVTLRVYNILGQEIATPVNKEQEFGSYQVQFDGRDLSSGVYFYRLQAGDFVDTKKLLLLK